MEHTDDTQPSRRKNEEQQKDQATHESYQVHSGQPKLLPYALRKGLTLGLIYVVLSALAYALGPRVMLHWSTQIGNWSMSLLSLGFVIGFVIFTGIRFRRAQNKGLSFGDGWIYSVVVFGGFMVLSLLWKLLLFELIDPDLGEAIIDKALEKYPEIGADPNAERSFRHEMGLAFKAPGIVLEALMSLLWYPLLSALSGFIIKKKPVSS